jgi:hypothetical protein
MNPLGVLRDTVRSKPLLSLVVCFIIAFLVGWWLMGYVIWPVQYVGEAYSYELTAPEKEQYIMMVADSYQLTGNAMEARSRLTGWDQSEIPLLIANVATGLRNQGREADAQRVEDLAEVLGAPSPGIVPTVPGSPQAPPSTQARAARLSVMSLIQICIGLIVILIVIAAVLFVVDLRRRRNKQPGSRLAARVTPTTVPSTVPLDQPTQGDFYFATKYTIGDDSYDESFSIETPSGEFLGECGIGISETIEAGPPDKVAAFEVWLFDKSDIRTVARVLMSEFAFNAPDLRDKLAPKGDAVMAQEGGTFKIETDSLNMEVRISELVYGTEQQEPNSYFDTLAVDIIARPHEGTE